MHASDPLSTVPARLAEEHLPLAATITQRLQRRYPWIDSEDLYGYALLGLTQAARSFCGDRGVSFAGYARVKGGFLAVDAMRQDGLLRRADAATTPATLCWSQYISDGPEGGACEVLDEQSACGHHTVDVHDLVASILGSLDPDDRRLLLMYYADGMTFREIGQVYHLADSTICLRHKALLRRLRRQVAHLDA